MGPEVAIVLGGASNTFKELDDALSLLDGIAPFCIVATNDAGVDYDGHLHHWATFHTEKMPKWVKRREELGRSMDFTLWTARHKGIHKNLKYKYVQSRGGSSGLVAVQVALLHCDKAILCGIPMEASYEHYHTEGKWNEAGMYRGAWERHATDLRGRIKSWSGWTCRTFGPPTEKWVLGPVDQEV